MKIDQKFGITNVFYVKYTNKKNSYGIPLPEKIR